MNSCILMTHLYLLKRGPPEFESTIRLFFECMHKYFQTERPRNLKIFRVSMDFCYGKEKTDRRILKYGLSRQYFVDSSSMEN